MTGKLLFAGMGLALLVFGFRYLNSVNSVNQETQQSIEMHNDQDSEPTASSYDNSPLDISNESKEELDLSSQISNSDMLEKAGDTELKNQDSLEDTTSNPIFTKKQIEEFIQNLEINDFESSDHYEIVVEMLRDGSIGLHQIERAKNFVAGIVMESEAELTEDLNEYNYEY